MNIYLSAINWGIIVNTIIAFAAILTAYYARKTLMSSLKAKEEERESRRSFFAPIDEPGFAFPDPLKQIQLKVVLKNFGQNPVVRAKVITFGVAISFKEEIKELVPIFYFNDSINNTIPTNGNLILEITSKRLKEIDVEFYSRFLTSFIIQKISYKDAILNKIFVEIFYWGIGEDKSLFEVSESDFEELTKVDLEKPFPEVNFDELLKIE